MSTSPQTAALFPEWKQEVNRRVAAHLNRKAHQPAETADPQQDRPARGNRAAQAAARVAARYAKAPSYSEVLAREARAAVHAAQAASKAARQAQAAFQYVLDGLQAATPAEPAPQPATPSPRQSAPAPPQAPAQLMSRIREEQATASRQFETAAPIRQLPAHARRPDREAPAFAPATPAEPVDIVQPIYGNLIEFPREMVATRRARPRRAEGPLADAGSVPQLSIFEVDPAAISIEPPPAVLEPAETPAWMRREWPALDTNEWPALPNAEAQPPASIPEALMQQVLLEEPAAQSAPATQIEPAPMSRRLLAMVVDCALIAAALIGAALPLVAHVRELPGLRAVEFGAGAALIAIGIAYFASFLTLARSTPGMWYAGIELITLAGCTTTRAERWRRLMSAPLALLPLGLGFAWALFDEGQLMWHDRLSKTCLRKR